MIVEIIALRVLVHLPCQASDNILIERNESSFKNIIGIRNEVAYLTPADTTGSYTRQVADLSLPVTWQFADLTDSYMEVSRGSSRIYRWLECI